MSVVNLYNGIYQVLSNDQKVLNYLGIDTSSSLTDKATHIQKRSRPQRLADSIPLVAFYAPPGVPDKNNHLVYTTAFVFDVYTADDVALAQQIAERICELFVGEMHPMQGVESMQSEFVTSHESSVDVENAYCFTTVIDFSVSIEKYYQRSDT